MGLCRQVQWLNRGAIATVMTVDAAQSRRWASLALMAASGFAGLGYQIVWTQQCALWLGHESAAVLAVVTAFFGGLALGALALGARIERSGRPVRWYAACEMTIALWSLLIAFAMAPISGWMLEATGVQPSPLRQWGIAFGGTFALLLPATAAMGATLPAMERVALQIATPVRSIGALYACNTLGAVIGVLAIAFWLAPGIGLARTAGVCIALNLACVVLAMAFFPARTKPDIVVMPSDPSAAHNALARLAATGLLGIGYEVLVVRVLSQVAQDTVYTFAMLLAVYLLGTASGAAGYQRWLLSAFVRDAGTQRDRLLCTLAAAIVLGTASLWATEWLKASLVQFSGPSMGAALTAEAVLAVVAFGPATIVMGALFSHLTASASAAGVSFGRAVGINTLGAAAAPLTFGVLALPTLGPKIALLLIAFGYLMLTRRTRWSSAMVWVPASFALALGVWAGPLAFVDVPDGGRVVSYRDGIMAAVSVVEDRDGVLRLRIDNRQQEGSSATVRADARQALLPLLLHPAPKRTLFLGLGSGVTASSAARDPTLQVDAVELLPEVIEASAMFAPTDFDDASRSRFHVMAADARRFVRASAQRYDVIVSDNYHPARSGSGSLYTAEHFAAVRERLADGGVFCQWLPLHQLDLQTLRSVVRSFLLVYPRGWAMLASNSLETPVLGLVGRRDGGRFDPAKLRVRMANAVFAHGPADVGIEDEYALFGSFVAGPAALQRFAGDAAANTDDLPVVAYRAPRITYAPDSLPRDRLFALLDEVSIEPAELLAPMDDAFASRLAAYWMARNAFLVSGRSVRPTADVVAMLVQVRAPLLSALHTSPDFRPAYDPLVRMAIVLAHTDAADARALLAELAKLQPARTEATDALREIGEDP